MHQDGFDCKEIIYQVTQLIEMMNRKTGAPIVVALEEAAVMRLKRPVHLGTKVHQVRCRRR